MKSNSKTAGAFSWKQMNFTIPVSPLSLNEICTAHQGTRSKRSRSVTREKYPNYSDLLRVLT